MPRNKGMLTNNAMTESARALIIVSVGEKEFHFLIWYEKRSKYILTDKHQVLVLSRIHNSYTPLYQNHIHFPINNAMLTASK